MFLFYANLDYSRLFKLTFPPSSTVSSILRIETVEIYPTDTGVYIPQSLGNFLFDFVITPESDEKHYIEDCMFRLTSDSVVVKIEEISRIVIDFYTVTTTEQIHRRGGLSISP